MNTQLFSFGFFCDIHPCSGSPKQQGQITVKETSQTELDIVHKEKRLVSGMCHSNGMLTSPAITKSGPLNSTPLFNPWNPPVTVTVHSRLCIHDCVEELETRRLPSMIWVALK